MEPAGMVRILLLEDNPGDALLIKEMLADLDQPWSMTTVDRLSAALELLEKEEFSLILSDLNLPDSNGLETLRRILQKKPDIKVITLSGTFQDDTSAEAEREGAAICLTKGIESYERLAGIVRRLLK